MVYVKVRSTTLAACSGGSPTLNKAEIKLKRLNCPNDDFKIDNVSSWSCVGPLTDANCTDYYEYTIGFNLPPDWINTSAFMEIKLEDGGDKFKAYETLTIGSGDCSSVKFYSDAGYTTEVNPWEFDKGSTYYMRVITSNLNNNAPKNNKAKLKIEDFYKNKIFEDKDFFTLTGTQTLPCSGGSAYGVYDGNFTVPNAPPPGGSDWKSEPVAGWYYNFKVELEANAGNCDFDYKDTLLINGSGGGGPPPPPGGGPLDEAASSASATQNPPGTPDWHGSNGGNNQFLIKFINETAGDIVMVGFDLSNTVAQPNLKHVQSRTAANGWTKPKIWNGNISLPTGYFAINSGGIDDWTIPANSYVVIDDFHFTGTLNPGTFTLIVYFQSGASSTLVFNIP